MKKEDEVIWREQKVKETTGLSRTTRWRMIKRERFPSPIKIGESAVGWLRSEILQWIEDKVAAREGENG